MEQTFNEEKESTSSFDIKQFFSRALKSYPWFLLAIVLFVAAANIYLRYTVPLFQVITYIQIKLPTDATSLLGGSPFSSGPNTSSMNVPDANNEIFKLQSAELIGDVVDSLKLDIAVTQIGRVKSKPLDADSLPFELSVHKAFPDHETPVYKLSLYPASYKIEWDKNSSKGSYDQPIVLRGDTINIKKVEPFNISKNNLYGLKISGRTNTINTYMSRLVVVSLPKAGVGILQVSLRDELSRRAKKFIDVLINRYDVANREFKNQSLHVEMDFLNNRLASVSQELQQQENLVRDFKTGNKTFDVSSSANQLLGSLPAIDSKKVENDLKSGLLDLIESNIKSYNGKEEIVPNASGVQDAVLADLISKYNQLIFQKSNILTKGTAQDPRLAGINGQLQDLRANILKNVSNIRKEITTNVSSLATQERTITGRFQNLPTKEKEFIEINRMMNIKQTLYTFLLQKREDKNIQLASSDVSESRIIDTRSNSSVQDPKPIVLYLMAVALGFILPAIIILIKLVLSKTIQSRKDVENLTIVPIVGEIAQAEKLSEEMVITLGARTAIAEQFRTLRTNIAYLAQGFAHKVFLITSFKTEEGKSFISLNLANSIAISQKKVVLIEFDLHQPGLADFLNAEKTIGVSNFLSNDMLPEEIIQPSKDYVNLSFISAGHPLPTNPGELILSKKMETLFEYLRLHFDIIIVDTPPVGAVSDALTISQWADMSFFIVRHKYSLRSSLKLVNELSEVKKLPNMALIINGIQGNKEFGYGEGYGYGYGYGEKPKKKKRTKKPLEIGLPDQVTA